ncbi:MAG: hypothetical protein PHQ98_04065 [Candidatus ainarchaeum sp.]|nr:hypothetical protein [Candidatus ainarchaeum sp.]
MAGHDKEIAIILIIASVILLMLSMGWIQVQFLTREYNSFLAYIAIAAGTYMYLKAK